MMLKIYNLTIVFHSMHISLELPLKETYKREFAKHFNFQDKI